MLWKNCRQEIKSSRNPNAVAHFKVMENGDFRLFEANYTHVDDANVEDASGNQQPRCHDFENCHGGGEFDRTRAIVWTICSSAAIFTTKHLLISHGFPLVISTLYFIALLLAYMTIISSNSCQDEVGSATDRWSTSLLTKRVKPNGLSPDRTWIWMVPSAIAAALALPLFVQALLHMASLPVLVMLFPISFATESVVCFTLSIFLPSPLESERRLSSETFWAICATALVLYNEYRLTVPGILYSCGACISIGVCRASLSIASHKLVDEDARSKSYHEFALMTMIYGVVFSAFGALRYEVHILSYFPDSTTRLMILLGTTFTIGACLSGTALHVYTPICSSFTSARSGVSHSVYEIGTSFFVTALIFLATLAIEPVTVVSWAQVASYLSAVLCLVGFSRVHIIVEDASNVFRKRLQELPYEPQPNAQFHPKISKLFGLLVILLATALTTTVISSICHIRLSTLSPGLSTTLDKVYMPERSSFDIVISAYAESPSSIAHMISSIKSTSYLSTLQPRVIIYTKNPATDLSYLQNTTGADIVQLLPNLGREGATFLHHIVNSWDNLAEKTMFIQAHAHNMRELIPRIDSYLVPNTGMLSLSFSGETCSCMNCGDHFGWSDTWSVVPSLYESVYQQPCEEDTEVLLSYKGQFVASARRIRGVQKSVYEGLLETITSESGWSHDGRFVSESDSPDNPDFGFVVERVWSLLMQCAVDEKVERMCPSLLSGMGWGGDVADCQCLDDIKVDV
ncbi:hypothetical protein CJF32_00008291 [Rutstroemia sp. NJR-2017a WRK4]|nr:hypothetical protein CJF32_00008291 [Rutstroemia sp. NJR-2017a WRK4]